MYLLALVSVQVNQAFQNTSGSSGRFNSKSIADTNEGKSEMPMSNLAGIFFNITVPSYQHFSDGAMIHELASGAEYWKTFSL